MRKINELNLSVSSNTADLFPKQKSGKFGFVGNVGQLTSNASSLYGRNVNSFRFEKDDIENEEEEESMNNDKAILEMAYVTSENAYRLREINEYTLRTGNVIEVVVLEENLISATFESAKAWFGDIIKNLLSTGAIVLSGGAAGDTVVDVLFAIYRTKEVYDAYNDIMSAAGVLKDFLKEMNELELENNIDEIKEIAIGSVIELASIRPNLGASAIDKIKSTSGFEKASGLFAKVVNYIEELKDKFIDFMMKMINSLADWIGSFLPDDFGAGSALFKGVMRDIIDTGLDMALQKITDMIENLPGQLSSVVLSKSKLTEYLTELCNDVVAGLKKGGIFTPSWILSVFDLDSVCKKIPGAVDIYTQFMKYIIAFFCVIDGLADGTIEEAIETGEYSSSVRKIDASEIDAMELLQDISSIKDDPMAMLDYFYNNQIDLESLTFGEVAPAEEKQIAESHELFFEKKGFTSKYDDHKKLKGKQKKGLPDHLQKAIIGKSKNETSDNIDEESFEEIDLEEFASAGGIGGYTLPLGASNKQKSDQKDHHRLLELQKEVNEQVERMRMLEAYHQKTTNRIK